MRHSDIDKTMILCTTTIQQRYGNTEGYKYTGKAMRETISKMHLGTIKDTETGKDQERHYAVTSLLS